jgi:predicted nucleic acid-binding Zn ribbon protein
MAADPIPLDWDEKSKCIRCGTPVASNRDFCSKECEDSFFEV